ncbi:hypothetical protein CSOJ01_01226 [Colletotrichum sojae]|uniref:Uncharacterized protein n=1 Tax=Colletotrichum sojae TaxID=2175907 RepID=A0A8H6JUW4_9PEZI|nr:hypothetical protein CSOJ01_01226 [Colletotrichum sojae]
MVPGLRQRLPVLFLRTLMPRHGRAWEPVVQLHSSEAGNLLPKNAVQPPCNQPRPAARETCIVTILVPAGHQAGQQANAADGSSN